jgi:hypothetical protein
LMPQKAVGIKDGVLSVQPDRSIVASGGKNERDTYTITYQTSLKNLSAVRLEVLADPKLPKNGPGRAPGDGNFVLTEFQVLVQPVGSKDLPKKIDLTTPLADFSQENYDVRFAVDGDEGNRDRGWAVSPQTGHTHWATFQLKDEIKYEEGAIITVRMVHNFSQNTYNLGRFRVSFAGQKSPVGLSLADDYRSIIQTPAAERTKEQNETIFAYFKKIDPGIRDRQKALADAQRPLPIDPDPASQRCEDERRPVGQSPLDGRSGYFVGSDQQPGVFVQSLTAIQGATLCPFDLLALWPV